MCVVCGCSGSSEHVSDHHHADEVISTDSMNLHFGLGSAKVSVPGLSQERTIQLEADVLGANQKIAHSNRTHFESHGVLALNLVSSPGSGKTSLLCATIQSMRRLYPHIDLAVIEGDQQTSHDANRIRATGTRAVQVNTGKGCHLDAPMVARAFEQLHSHQAPPQKQACPYQILFIENVGNLVCPALWDLGEAAKVVILSVTEGEDKPLKYPDMFAAAKVMIINKIDLLPYLRFDLDLCLTNARRINPDLTVFLVSADSGEGMDSWLEWLIQPVTPRFRVIDRPSYVLASPAQRASKEKPLS